MEDELLRDLPRDLPTFLARFGSDAQCRAYLVRARWPEGFRCAGCGHERAYSHKLRLIEECAACGKQHSLLAGTIFEQTKTGLARWFLAIYLVTSSKGGISAMELQRQMGFGSYQTAWSWLHKIRQARWWAGPPAARRAGRGRRDLGRRRQAGQAGPRRRAARRWSPARSRAAAARRRGRRLGRLRLQAVPDASASSLEGFLAGNVASPADGRHRRLVGLCAGSRPRATPTSRSTSPPAGATRRCACRRSTSSSGSPSAGCSAPTTVPSATKHLPGLSRRVRLPLQPPHRQEHQPPLRPPDRAGGPHPPGHLPRHRRRGRLLKVMES